MTLNINSYASPIASAGGELSGLGGGIPLKSDGDFGGLVKEAVASIDGTNKAAEQEITRAISGESNDLHKTIIALQTADLKMQLGLQVRNKLMGAYDEIMRMQV